MKLYNIKLRVISVQYSSLTIKSTPHLLINIVNRDYPLYEIESGLNHMELTGRMGERGKYIKTNINKEEREQKFI